MSSYCTACGNWRPTPHDCYPVYEARDATDDGVGFQPDDPWKTCSEVRASGAEYAAESFAEKWDQGGDSYLARSESNEIIVEVRPVSDRANVQRFKCRAEHSVSYYAEPVSLASAAAGESA